VANNNNIIRTEKDGIEFFTVVATGESGLSQSGLARLCGKSQQAISKLVISLTTKCEIKRLKRFVGKPLTLTTNASGKHLKARNATIYNSEFCFAVIKHYAIEGSEIAENTLDAIGEIGINSFIQGVTGWLPKEYQSNPEARNRVLDQKRKRVHPLFGDENMNKVASFLKVGRNHPKLAKWMWCYIYCTFSQEEICKLNVNNPVQPNGHRKDCIYEWLEENATEAHKKHFDKVLTLVQISTSQQEFANMFNRMFSDVYQQEFF
jgi:hypothetical protein